MYIVAKEVYIGFNRTSNHFIRILIENTFNDLVNDAFFFIHYKVVLIIGLHKRVKDDNDLADDRKKFQEQEQFERVIFVLFG
jgi:hypothetical protein